MPREPIRRPFMPRNNHTASVTLDAEVLAKAAAFATQIEMANRKRKRRNVQGLTAKGKESLRMRVMGYSGEAALAIHLGMNPDRMHDDWRGRGSVAYPDVGPFDVMTTDKPHGALIVTPRDRLDMMKVLVIDVSPVFHICGWYRVGDVRLEAERSHSEWWQQWREGGGAWYVPQAFLKSLQDEEAHTIWTRYLAARVPQFRPQVLTQEGEERLITFAGTAAPFANPDDHPDWREVLRRAGAEPLTEKAWKAQHLGTFPPERPPKP